MKATRMFSQLREKYISDQRKRSTRCSQLHAEYSRTYHEFIMIRDLHVRLRGSCFWSGPSDFMDSELVNHKRAMVAGCNYVKHVIDTYDIDMVVPCRQAELRQMTRERLLNELVAPLHPDMINFVLCVEQPSRFGSPVTFTIDFYPDLFPNRKELKYYTGKMREIIYRYYPLYAVHPCAQAGIYCPVNSKRIGSLEGSLVYSEVQHANVKMKLVERAYPKLGKEIRQEIIKFLFPKLTRGFAQAFILPRPVADNTQ